MKTALNHMTTPNLGYGEFLDLASRLGCVGVEVRNDIARPLFDGMAAEAAGDMARARGLRLVGLSQIYPFNAWTPQIEQAVRDLVAIAKTAGAETISLIPRNDGQGTANGERQGKLRVALKGAANILNSEGMTALVEPLGFVRSSLRYKTELVATIDALGLWDTFRIVHDTFHHALADGDRMFPDRTGIVHISAVTDPSLSTFEMEDEHRVLVDERDRLGNVEQISALLAAGYDGVFSYECFSPLTHSLSDPLGELRRSFDFISSRLTPTEQPQLRRIET
ncbi:MAG: TIM barrel protein [Rhodobacteraceae bacterium]|nr:TIM barrel protein [Paracoccaceae bacterium]